MSTTPDDDGDRVTLRSIAGWAFRLYLLALLVGVLAVVVSWATGSLTDHSATVGQLWLGIAGLGTVILVLLLAVRVSTEEAAE